VGVVEHHRHAVGGPAQVRLHAGAAAEVRLLERREAVLRGGRVEVTTMANGRELLTTAEVLEGAQDLRRGRRALASDLVGDVGGRTAGLLQVGRLRRVGLDDGVAGTLVGRPDADGLLLGGRRRFGWGIRRGRRRDEAAAEQGEDGCDGERWTGSSGRAMVHVALLVGWRRLPVRPRGRVVHALVGRRSATWLGRRATGWDLARRVVAVARPAEARHLGRLMCACSPRPPLAAVPRRPRWWAWGCGAGSRGCVTEFDASGGGGVVRRLWAGMRLMRRTSVSAARPGCARPTGCRARSRCPLPFTRLRRPEVPWRSRMRRTITERSTEGAPDEREHDS
jgi:hypothetical protein